MPVIHEKEEGSGIYIKSYHKGVYTTWQVTYFGVELLRNYNLAKEGQEIKLATLLKMKACKIAYTNASGVCITQDDVNVSDITKLKMTNEEKRFFNYISEHKSQIEKSANSIKVASSGKKQVLTKTDINKSSNITFINTITKEIKTTSSNGYYQSNNAITFNQQPKYLNQQTVNYRKSINAQYIINWLNTVEGTEAFLRYAIVGSLPQDPNNYLNPAIYNKCMKLFSTDNRCPLCQTESIQNIIEHLVTYHKKEYMQSLRMYFGFFNKKTLNSNPKKTRKALNKQFELSETVSNYPLYKISDRNDSRLKSLEKILNKDLLSYYLDMFEELKSDCCRYSSLTVPQKVNNTKIITKSENTDNNDSNQYNDNLSEESNCQTNDEAKSKSKLNVYDENIITYCQEDDANADTDDYNKDYTNDYDNAYIGETSQTKHSKQSSAVNDTKKIKATQRFLENALIDNDEETCEVILKHYIWGNSDIQNIEQKGKHIKQILPLFCYDCNCVFKNQEKLCKHFLEEHFDQLSICLRICFINFLERQYQLGNQEAKKQYNILISSRSALKKIASLDIYQCIGNSKERARLYDFFNPDSTACKLTKDKESALKRYLKMIDYLSDNYLYKPSISEEEVNLNTTTSQLFNSDDNDNYLDSLNINSLNDYLLKHFGYQLKVCHAGTFIMGSPQSECGRLKNESIKQVTINNDFAIGIYPVTERMYHTVMKSKVDKFSLNRKPICNITWDEVADFCQKFNEMCKRFLPANYTFALPTEAEWEYACRAGCNNALYNNSELVHKENTSPMLDKIAWYAGNSGLVTHKVGKKEPNNWGLYDMLGNVWEWSDDSIEEDPDIKIIKGGSATVFARYCRCASKSTMPTGSKDKFCGFRIVLIKNE